MAIRIPKDQIQLLSQLAQTSDDRLEVIVDQLGKLTPKLHVNKLREELEQIFDSPESSEDSAGFAEVVISLALFYARSNFSLDEYARDVSKVVPKKDRRPLQSLITKILNVRSVSISAKASSIQVSHDRVFNSCFIATDVRPVFEEPVGVGLAGSLVIHQLRMISVHNQSTEELYFALDDDDLASLRTTVDRALQKSLKLREWLKEKQEGKWKDYPDYGIAKKGLIALQDHGHKAYFKNMMIKVL